MDFYGDRRLGSGDTLQLLIFIYLLIAVGLTAGGISTVHNYTQAIHGTTQFTTLFGKLSGI